MPAAATTLAEFATRLTYASLPEDVVAHARLHLLDVVGCGLAAVAAGTGTEAQAWVAGELGSGRSELWGTGERAGAADAALANGMAAHALDFDDTHPASMTHVSAVIAPAALAVAQARGASGRELLTALVAGTEVTTRIAMARPGLFHERGLHPTSVCGVFGATVAVGRLLGLTRLELVAALGIAGSTASGLFEFLADGTATKPFHAGWAAHAAVVAASLARRGATGPATVLEGRYGLFNALLGEDATDALAAQCGDLGARWETRAVAIKPYPACHMTHAAIDGARSLRERGLAAEDVAALHVQVPEAAVGLVLEPAARKAGPETPYEAKFSLPFSAGAMLVDGEVTLASYREDRLGDERILALARRCTYTVVAPDDRGPFFTILAATRGDGATVTVDVAHPSGTAEAPLGDDAVRIKFMANAQPLLGDRADDLADALLQVDGLTELPGLGSAYRPVGCD
jgi:2-methylcitrate dehydratase PrpD